MVIVHATGTIADVDPTAPVLILEHGGQFERFVVSPVAWGGPVDALQVGRRVRLTAHAEINPKPGAMPVAFRLQFVDVH